MKYWRLWLGVIFLSLATMIIPTSGASHDYRGDTVHHIYLPLMEHDNRVYKRCLAWAWGRQNHGDDNLRPADDELFKASCYHQWGIDYGDTGTYYHEPYEMESLAVFWGEYLPGSIDTYTEDLFQLTMMDQEQFDQMKWRRVNGRVPIIVFNEPDRWGDHNGRGQSNISPADLLPYYQMIAAQCQESERCWWSQPKVAHADRFCMTDYAADWYKELVDNSQYDQWCYLNEWAELAVAAGAPAPTFISFHNYQRFGPEHPMASFVEIQAVIQNHWGEAPTWGYVNEVGSNDPEYLCRAIQHYEKDERIANYAMWLPSRANNYSDPYNLIGSSGMQFMYPHGKQNFTPVGWAIHNDCDGTPYPTPNFDHSPLITRQELDFFLDWSFWPYSEYDVIVERICGTSGMHECGLINTRWQDQGLYGVAGVQWDMWGYDCEPDGHWYTGLNGGWGNVLCNLNAAYVEYENTGTFQDPLPPPYP